MILGLIFGTSTGETSFELLALMLPRFLLPLPAFVSFLSTIAEGVLTAIGEAKVGDSSAESDLVDVGVLNGPSFGVLRAEIRGVFSSAVAPIIWVSMSLRDGRREGRFVAASGSNSSSSPPCS